MPRPDDVDPFSTKAHFTHQSAGWPRDLQDEIGNPLEGLGAPDLQERHLRSNRLAANQQLREPGVGIGEDTRGFALDFSLSTVTGDCFVFLPETDLKGLEIPQVAVCVKWVQFPGITILDLRLPIELVLLWPLMQILRWLWRLG